MENIKCDYCGAELTEREIRLIAEAYEAYGLTVEQLAQSTIERMCGKCAEDMGLD